MVPATIAPYVVQTIGQKAARRLFMTGEMVHAERALSLGFLSEVVDAELLNTRVNEVAEMMLGNAPIGLSKAKQIIAAVSSGPVGDAMIDYTAKFITDIRLMKAVKA